MTEFRPTLAPATAPKPSPWRPATFAALAALVGLVALASWPDPEPASRSAPPTEASPALWDGAIAALTGGPAATPAPSTETPGRAPLAALDLVPHRAGGQLVGYEIRAGELPAPLAAAGLQAGDVLTTIDGLPIDPARAARLADEFGGLDDVEVSYRRGGEVRDTMIVFVER